MPKHRSYSLALAASLFASMSPAEAQPLGVPVGDNIFVSCEYRVAAIFPSGPMVRDITYEVGGRATRAREFYTEHNGAYLSVIVAHFPDGPEEDRELMEAAAESLRRRGEVRYETHVIYDGPAVPGIQLNVALPDERVLRGHVYVARHRLYVTEATSALSDSTAFRFEQSVSFIDENGTDLDSNVLPPGESLGSSSGLPSRQYICES